MPILVKLVHILLSPVIYVMGEKRITKKSLNDGQWHHVAFLWASKDGHWKLLVDGTPHDSGYDLCSSCTIPGEYLHKCFLGK